ncbi:MAG: electron transfer flavoprotein subunit beta/FixA family protein [Candidatus Sumerlaeia bacterium]|nr:electron transfer flavoprotein subunit beta/FixA family protein [Candidatus Sumerlaeia bacterium]
MRIVVCIKQVPDVTDVKINPQTNTLIREGVPSIINPFDTYAIEEGVRLREKYGGTVIVLTMGPPQAETALRQAIEAGADEMVLLSDRAFAGSDTLATSYALAAAIRKIGSVDIILCGKQAMDGDTGQVGPGIAEFLDLPLITYVKKIEEVEVGKRIRVEAMNDYGYDVYEAPLPCVMTVVKEINEPRMPSLRTKMKAKSAKLTTWKAEDIGAPPERIGLAGSPTAVWKIFTPKPRSGGEILHGSVSEVADQLYAKLKERLVI